MLDIKHDTINIANADLVSTSFFNEPGQMCCHLKLNDNLSIYAFRRDLKVSYANGIWDIWEIDIERKEIKIVMPLPVDSILRFGSEVGDS